MADDPRLSEIESIASSDHARDAFLRNARVVLVRVPHRLFDRLNDSSGVRHVRGDVDADAVRNRIADEVIAAMSGEAGE